MLTLAEQNKLNQHHREKLIAALGIDEYRKRKMKN